jgi:hypothetical protein
VPTGLDGFAIADQSFWIVCAAFYLVDNLRFHAGRELILTETWSRRWALVLPISHYRMRGRAVTFLNPLLPIMAVVKFTWLNQNAFAPSVLVRTKRLLRIYQRNLAPFRMLAAMYFVTLFILGPAATHYAGLAYALTFVLPIHLIGLTRLISLLVLDRRRWGMEWQQLASLAFECAVCPGYFVNVCRKLSLGYARTPGDAVAFVLDQGDPRLIALVAGGIDVLLEDLAEGDELRPDDEQPVAIYQALLAEVGVHA